MSKRIDVFVDHYYPSPGGLSLHCYYVYQIIKNKGWEVHIHTTRDTISQKNILPKYEIIEGIYVHRYNHLSYNINPFIFKFNYFKTNLIVLNELIVLPHYYIYLVSFLLKKLGLKKYGLILTSHGLFTSVISKSMSKTRLIKRKLDRTLGVFLVRETVDGVHAISQREKDGLVAFGINKDKIEVFGNGLDENAFRDVELLASKKIKEKVESIGKYFIQIGRIDRPKNYENAIRSLSLLPSEIKYVIVGPDQDAKYKEELVALIEELKLKERVLFLGIVNGIDKYYLLKHAIAYVQLSWYEGFPLVLYEAMSQGIIPIISSGTAMDEMIFNGINGYVIKPTDTKSLSEKIALLQNSVNNQEINKIKVHIKELSEDKTWINTAERLANLFNQAIKRI